MSVEDLRASFRSKARKFIAPLVWAKLGDAFQYEAHQVQTEHLVVTISRSTEPSPLKHSWRLRCSQLGFDGYVLAAEDAEDAKREAINFLVERLRVWHSELSL